MTMSVSSNTSFTVKSTLEDDCRRFTTPAVPTFEQLVAREASLFGLTTGSMRLKWIDEDGDAVTLASDDDVAMAFSQAENDGSNLVRLNVAYTVANVTNTNVSGNNTTVVPIDANVNTNAPEVVRTNANVPITAVPISDCNTNVSPLSDSPVTVTNIDGSKRNATVVNISDVSVNAGNTSINTAAAASVRNTGAPSTFVTRQNPLSWLPMLHQLQRMGFDDTTHNIDLLEQYRGNYLSALAHLVLEHSQQQQQQ